MKENFFLVFYLQQLDEKKGTEIKIRSNLSDLGPKTPLISFYFVIYKKADKKITRIQHREKNAGTFIFLLDLIEYF